MTGSVGGRSTVGRWSARGLAFAALALAVWFLHWTVAANGGFDDWGEADYYQLLVRGWKKGQLHLDKAPAPELLALADPYDPAQNGPHRLGDAKLNEDIVVPMRNYVKFAQFLVRLKRESGLPIPTFGHLADGNLHVNIMYHKAVPAECRMAEKTVQRLMETVVALGGAISGEHGIGLAKTPFLRLQHSPAQVRAMQAVKHALDPRGVLNPGKMFDVFHVWKHPRLDVKLPWDHK